MKKINYEWVKPEKIDIDLEIFDTLELPAELLEILIQRGFHTQKEIKSFLDPDQFNPTDPFSLQDMDKAVEIIENAVQEHKKIGIWGDFDVDGQTSTAVLVEGLSNLGAEAEYYIPSRIGESHGIKIPALKEFLDKDISVLVTCDTGISEIEAIQYAKSQGVKTIITDHHKIPDEIPPALAIINAQQLPDGHALKTVAGVGAAYKLIEALFINAKRQNELTKYHDLVALGMIADLVPLTGEARYLAQIGIQALRNTQRVGLKRLYKNSHINPERLNEEDISYRLAPRLNSIGRLENAALAVEFLLSTDEEFAKETATTLELKNVERRTLSDSVYQAAIAEIKNNPELDKQDFISLESTKWDGSVLGVVASRIAEEFNKPALLIAIPEGKQPRGSARSIKGIDITSAIAEQKELLLQYGGHAMAGGFSLAAENLALFKKGLAKHIKMQKAVLPEKFPLSIDAELPLELVDLDLVRQFERMRPFGPQNPRPLFVDQNLEILKNKPIGKNHSKITLKDLQKNTFDVLWWNSGQVKIDAEGINLAYTLHINHYYEKVEPRIEWKDAQMIELPVENKLEPKRRKKISIYDRRNEIPFPSDLKNLIEENDAIIWDENRHFPELEVSDRENLSTHEYLILLSPPPGNVLLKEILNRSEPKKTVFYNLENNLNDSKKLAAFLLKKTRSALSGSEKTIDTSTISSTTAHNPQTIQAGLRYILLNNHLDFHFKGNQVTVHGKADKIDEKQLNSARNEFQIRFEESRSYWKTFSKTNLQELLSHLSK